MIAVLDGEFEHGQRKVATSHLDNGAVQIGSAFAEEVLDNACLVFPRGQRQAVLQSYLSYQAPLLRGPIFDDVERTLLTGGGERADFLVDIGAPRRSLRVCDGFGKWRR